MTTVPASTRSTTHTLASASAGPFLVGFRIFDATLRAYVNGALRTDFTIAATFSDGYCDTAEVTFDTDLIAGDVLRIDGDMPVARGAEYLNPDPNLTQKINIEFGRIWAALQQLARDAGREPAVLQQARTYFHDIRDYGAVDGFDIADAMTDAIASAETGDTILIPNGYWPCATAVTVPSSKKLVFEVLEGATFNDATEFRNAVPGYINNTGNLFDRNTHLTDTTPDAGGWWEISGRRALTSSTAGYQWDMVRIHVAAEDESSGASWGGAGANINRDQVALAVIMTAVSGSINRAAWALNPYLAFLAGSDGQGTVMEVNLDLDPSITPVSDILAVKRKVGIYVVAKQGTGTAAFAFGGGSGFFKGLAAPQSALVNDPEARFVELTDMFEVMRTGQTLVGKGASSNLTPGVEMWPSGVIFSSTTGAATELRRTRTDTLTGAADVSTDQSRGRSSTGAERVFAQTIVNVSDHVNGTEDASYEWQTITAGTLSARLRLSTALNSLVPIQVNGTQVVNTRVTGWAAATGSATRTTFATGSVTLPQLAERVKALIDDLTAHGLIGA